MATVTICMALVWGSLIADMALAEPQSELSTLPLNVFEAEARFPRYLQWWRPLRVVFDEDKVADIHRRLAGLPAAQADYVELDSALGEYKDSAFVFPVLAVQGEKGLRILDRWLAEYRQGRQFDDRWLLIIATLGRMPSPESQRLLESELDRLFTEYDFEQRGPIPIVETYLPVIDALFACLAGQGRLTVEDIERLAPLLRGREGLGWLIALEWAQALMNREDLLELLHHSLAGCDDHELRRAMNHEKASARTRFIIAFLAFPRNNWDIARSLLLRHRERKDILGQFLRAEYLAIMVLQAEVGGGRYQIDEQVVDRLVADELPSHGGVAKNCWMLSNYEASVQFPGWEAFLKGHAAQLNDRDIENANHVVSRVLGRVELAPGFVEPRYELIELPDLYDEPGVHMLGFARAGGQHPVKLPGRK